MFLRYATRIRLILFLFIYSNILVGQVDSTYVKSFEQDFSARIYVYDKFAAFDMQNEKDDSRGYTYRTNSPISIGLGASWKNLSFSFSRGFDLFREKGKGKTNSYDFEYHRYGQKIIYDIFLQHHEGFYNDKRNADKSYTLYPDVKMNMYGGSLQYVFNNKKFSYKAAFNQNERQIKSAGSFQLGGSIYYSKVRSDSTILFEGMSRNHQNLQFGVTLGYAYTWVVDKHWFITGSLIGGVSMGNNHPKRFFKETMEVFPTVNGRFAFGYNAHSWSVGSSSHFNRVYLFFQDEEQLGMDNANFQITFIKRFDWGNRFVNDTLNKTKKKLRM